MVKVCETTWEIYNGMIGHWRFSEGATLQTIADRTNRTRERIRQVLNERYGTTGLKGFMSYELEVANLIGVPVSRLCKLRLSGIIKPTKQTKGKTHYILYDRNAIEKIMLALQRFCIHCGQAIPLDIKNWLICDLCSEERKRYPDPFLSKGAREKRREYVRNWIRNKRRIKGG